MLKKTLIGVGAVCFTLGLALNIWMFFGLWPSLLYLMIMIAGVLLIAAGYRIGRHKKGE